LRLGGEELDFKACGDMQRGAFGFGGESGGFADEAVFGLGGDEGAGEEEEEKGTHDLENQKSVVRQS
jgi:hypothetical protein